jgi:hypothetical protein
LDEKLFQHHESGDRGPVGARNPLVLSGLVLAGANLPAPTDLKELLQHDGGILTAEAIAGLSLDKLELAVLSACETGLGDVAGGEGVLGLTRAFHLGGTHNVIASLWQVNDEATAALMGLFYHNLWHKQLKPLEALRQAQLYVYLNPERIPALAQQRKFDLDKVVPVEPAKPPPAASGRSAVKLWAGWLLSGAGR